MVKYGKTKEEIKMGKSKKKKSAASKYAKYLYLAFSVLVVVMAFLPFVISKSDNSSDVTYTGFEVAFGKTLNSASFLGFASGSAKINMSYLLIVALFIPLVGSVIALFVKNRKLASLVVCVCFIVSAILVFMTPTITSVTYTGEVLGFGSTNTETFAYAGYSLAVGSILSGVFGALGGVTAIANLILK